MIELEEKQVRLSCGHLARILNDWVELEFHVYGEDFNSTVIGRYCKDCAKGYDKELGAWVMK